ncbi:MAG: monovalent cation/H+ antiporter subunit D family protein [Candidatus Competibacteraceae bacterium]|nr:monovalent cation/H+ antiporter subunit D family protein [Candidatus Competibacteraceae bacterium]MCB1804045.1 monovalent cation/H+ antiporter subunit D family protein [Candidatus Competibacteraceae bacterium]MCB1810149.1 monovalent cation/H+ antiporter subunit D family protein [Candidatus Competibacteraceae bacterium]
MSHHLPILQVILSLLAAPLCALLPAGRLPWLLALVVSTLSLLIAGTLLSQVWDGAVISYALGGWPPPIGIEYRVDVLNAFILLLVTIIGTLVMLYAYASINSEIERKRQPLFYAAYLLCLSGLLGITITGDAFNVFVFLEISSLATYTMIALGRNRRALTASYQYLIMGTIGATFILIGIGLLYAMTGTLNMADLAVRLPAVDGARTVQAAFAFLTVGICLKLALFPLHLWLPNAYAYAPSVVTAFIAATATKVAVYLLLRFFFTIFGNEFSFGSMHLHFVLLPLALAAILATSTVAIFQNNIKRLLAYSSVAQIGYMILGIAFASVTGVTAGILHLFNHALMKSALFLALGCVVYRIGSCNLNDMAGLGKRMPWTMAAFVAGGLSLIGVPLTVGFISKWYLILGALERGWWWVAVLVLIGSLLAVIYIWRVVETAYFKPAPEGQTARCEAPLSMLVPMWILVLANFYFGIDASLSTGAARFAAQQLLGVAP